MRRLLLVIVVAMASSRAGAQVPIELERAQSLALENDPRARQAMLRREQTALRLEELASERLPSIAVDALAQYQSDVVRFPVTQEGVAPPAPPRDTWDLGIRADQILLDPSRAARREAEEARLAEALAGLDVTLYTLRLEVNEVFFVAALLQEREEQLGLAITDLEARLEEARLRVDAGAALRGDAAAIHAVLLERRQDLSAVRAERKAALARLGALTGMPIDPSSRLVLPDLAREVAGTRANLAAIRMRPELAAFSRTIERLESRARLAESSTRPQASAFARAGYGKPGLNFMSDDFDGYWVAGIRIRWEPMDRGRAERERRLVDLEQRTVDSEREAFERALLRNIEADLAAIDHLESVATLDEEIIALRALIERETRLRHAEGLVTAAEYVDRHTDLLEARVRRAVHRVELARAQAQLLTELGVSRR